MVRLRIASLCLALVPLLQAQGPPAGAGATIQSLAADLAALTTRVTDLEGRVTSLEGRATTVEGRATSLEGRATTVEGRATSLEGRATTVEGRATSLEGRVSKLEGQIVSDDLAGTYAFWGFQNELSPAYVSSYVFAGTLVLQANGTFSGTGTENGNTLLLSTLPRSVIDFPIPPRPPEVLNGNWTYGDGVLDLGFGFTFKVGAGGRVITAALANHADRTNVILIGVRLQ